MSIEENDSSNDLFGKYPEYKVILLIASIVFFILFISLCMYMTHPTGNPEQQLKELQATKDVQSEMLLEQDFLYGIRHEVNDALNAIQWEIRLYKTKQEQQ